ncbi:hypothetical protein [Flavobacterium reichenbachii]|uniref:Uncharacterized protein n=1 Tax=Flavobacterium reichenbachii TaxID=362418 RepID=A0A085ZK80_9FLAO|nr:hypothetical protein [Flavobacterium reichenbachii]KFF04844.1 hypothetical protein IW19_04550 [Flavobacterium reichenbachii]OXB12169.1 hypothetical protein B0A68_19610 [Flavobacterium reichenbachii]
MIKSYKTVVIIQILVILIGGFALHDFHYTNDFNRLPTTIVLLIGSSVLILWMFSILIQMLIAGIFYSNSTINEVSKDVMNDKFWRNSFSINLGFGILAFIVSVVAIVSNLDLAVPGYDSSDRFFISLAILIVSSLVISLLLHIKKSVNITTKLLGFLMILISVIVFAGSLFVASTNALMVKSYNRDSLYGILKKILGEDVETPSNEKKVTKVVVPVKVVSKDDAKESDHDYYGFSKMSFPDLETGDYFIELFDETYTKSKVQELFGFFLSDFLSLQRKQSICYLRGSIELGFYSYRYDDLVAVDKMIGRNPESIQKTFDSYSPLIYAFISDETYYDSNLNVIVDILIESHNDIYRTENPEEALNKIYKIMVLGKNTQYPDFHFKELSKFASKKVLDLIKQNTKGDPDPDYSVKVSTFWIYSFWARRYKEKNIDVVFEIIKEIKQHYEVDDDQ